MYSAESTAVVAVSSVLLPLASVFVALRFKIRKSTKAGIGLDDYTILAALIIQYAGGAINIFGVVAGGEGDSETNIVKHPSEKAYYAKLQYIVPIIFATTVALVKVSTLILYKRIFVTKGFHLACHMVMILTAAWLLTSILGEIFSYKTPSKGPENPDGPFSINYPGFLLSMGAINMILDVFVVCMPMSVIQAMQMSSARKAQVSGNFLLGFFCIVAAAVRVYYLQVVNNYGNEVNGRAPASETSQLDTLFHTIIIGIIWFLIEAHTSIIAACLPTLAPLFRSDQHAPFQVRSVPNIFTLTRIRSEVSKTSFEADSEHTNQGGENHERRGEDLMSNPCQQGFGSGDSNVELRVMEVV